MRCSGAPQTVASIHAALRDRFNITTSDGTRFLGMDTRYDVTAGILEMGMSTYIVDTMTRFNAFDLSLGCPYREIVGCLLWIVLCVNGPDLVRVKDLARRSNAPTLDDYHAAVKVLKRIYKRRHVVILFKKGLCFRIGQCVFCRLVSHQCCLSSGRPRSSVSIGCFRSLHAHGC